MGGGKEGRSRRARVSLPFPSLPRGGKREVARRRADRERKKEDGSFAEAFSRELAEERRRGKKLLARLHLLLVGGKAGRGGKRKACLFLCGAGQGREKEKITLRFPILPRRKRRGLRGGRRKKDG